MKTDITNISMLKTSTYPELENGAFCFFDLGEYSDMFLVHENTSNKLIIFDNTNEVEPESIL